MSTEDLRKAFHLDEEDSFFDRILSSQSDLHDQLVSLQVVDGERRIDDKLGEFHRFLTSETMRNVPIDILDKDIFNEVLGGVLKLYNEIMKAIKKTVIVQYTKNQNNVVDELKGQLNTLSNALRCWDLCTSHIRTLEKVSIIDVKSFPPSLFDIITDVLTHCKNSSKDYGDLFQPVSENLTALFRQCVSILNSFYVLLDSAVISFDVNQDDEMNLMSKVIDETGKIATLASGMDIKTLSEMWRRFAKFATIYNLEMKNLSPNTITFHFRGLSYSIIDILSAINQRNPRATNERYILCCRVLLKILETMCETYCGWIRNDVMLAIVMMLGILYKYSEQNLKISGYDIDFIKFVVSNFTFMYEPFLGVVFKNDSFKVAFFEHGKNISEDVADYHLLLLTIVKKLSTLSYETQQEWSNQNNCILDICFQNIDKLSKDICIGKLKIQISRDEIQGSYLAGIYEATCLNIFSLACQVSSTDFPKLETLLLKYLLNGKIFSALLSSDVWCFICRLGSSEMCYSHFKYLMQVYEKFGQRKYNFNVIILANLLSRQYNFLSDKDKQEFVNSITKSSDPQRWSSIVRMMNEQKKKQLQQQIDVAATNTRISTDLQRLEGNPSLNNLSSLMKDLSIIEASDSPLDEQSSEAMVKMWNKIVCSLGDSEGTLLLLSEDLAFALLRAFHSSPDQTNHTFTVLESMVSVYPFASSHLRLEFCRFLCRNAINFTINDSTAVAELFCRLLSDDDHCVQQQAFESFEYMTQSCPNAEFLSSVVVAIRSAQPELSRTLPAYICGQVAHSLVGFANTDEFFSTLCDSLDVRKHVCHKRSQVVREDKLLKLDPSVDNGKVEEMVKRAEQVCIDVELMTKFKGQLRKDVYEKLRNACQTFLDQ